MTTQPNEVGEKQPSGPGIYFATDREFGHRICVEIIGSDGQMEAWTFGCKAALTIHGFTDYAKAIDPLAE